MVRYRVKIDGKFTFGDFARKQGALDQVSIARPGSMFEVVEETADEDRLVYSSIIKEDSHV